MSGLYVHIPYCTKACHYCDFHFSTVVRDKDEMFEALLWELSARKEEYPESGFDSIYFGGGTPSILSGDQISAILNRARSEYDVAEDVEVTLEANPDDLTKRKLEELYHAGINRLSIGCQSFDDKALLELNRSHSVEQIYSAIDQARVIGFKNLSLDLIFALPEMSVKDLEKNLIKIGELNPEHVSIYGLTIEPNTVFHHLLKNNKLKLPSEKDQEKQYLLILNKLRDLDYDHYEISNFGKKGFYSRHNKMYWENKPYLGIGPSAHSYYYLNNRYWNISNNSKYLNQVRNKQLIPESEELTMRDRHNELILTGLRQRSGLWINAYQLQFGKEQYKSLLKSIAPYLEDHLIMENEHLMLTDKGCLIADRISSELFI